MPSPLSDAHAADGARSCRDECVLVGDTGGPGRDRRCLVLLDHARACCARTLEVVRAFSTGSAVSLPCDFLLGEREEAASRRRFAGPPFGAHDWVFSEDAQEGDVIALAAEPSQSQHFLLARGWVVQDWLVGPFATEGALCHRVRADGGEQRNSNR